MPKIIDSLKTMTGEISYADRADLKSATLVNIGGLIKSPLGEFLIEVISITPIVGGIEMFLRAWDNKGNPIGFGDGSVETERWRVINPPILVPDELGTIVYTTNVMGFERTATYREDPEEALRLLAKNFVRTHGKLNADVTIGKVGKTVSDFFPSSDGGAERNNAGTETWATIRAGNGTTTTTWGQGVYWEASSTSNQWVRMWRGQLKFDTSSLPDGDTISDATIYLYGDFKQDPDSATPNVNIYQGTTTGLASTDFQNTSGNTTEFSTSITYAGWSTAGYNAFALNASGIANISKTGTSGFSTKNANYDVANTSPAWTAGHQTGVVWFGSVEAGTTKDPYISITHTAGSSFTPSPMMHMMAVSGGIM